MHICIGNLTIGWGNGLVPSGSKPLLQPMLSQICCHMASLGHNELSLGITGPNSMTICCISLAYYWHKQILINDSYTLSKPQTNNTKHGMNNKLKWAMTSVKCSHATAVIVFHFVFFPRGPFYQHGLPLIPAWISNHMSSQVWDEITCPFTNFNRCTIEVWEWISNSIPHFIMDVIT